MFPLRICKQGKEMRKPDPAQQLLVSDLPVGAVTSWTGFWDRLLVTEAQGLVVTRILNFKKLF